MGRRTRFLAFPVETWGSLFHQHHVPRNSTMQVTPYSGQRMNLKGRGSTADWGSASASGQSSPEPRSARKASKLEAKKKKKMCTVTSKVKEKIPFSKTT